MKHIRKYNNFKSNEDYTYRPSHSIIPPNDNEDELYGVEEDKSIIYRKRDDKDICMYFGDDSKELILTALNSMPISENLNIKLNESAPNEELQYKIEKSKSYKDLCSKFREAIEEFNVGIDSEFGIRSGSSPECDKSDDWAIRNAVQSALDDTAY